MTSARAPLSALGLTALVLGSVALHADVRALERQGQQAAIDAIMRLLPGADLSFAGSARHLRFPSLEEPGAAFADAPASPDLDPAGAAVAPPTAMYMQLEPRRSHASAAPLVEPSNPR